MIKVMLVDDQAAVLRNLENAVDWKALGFFVVTTASDGNEAWDKFQQHLPRLVVTDVQMPGMSGLELARKIKDTAPNTCIVFISNYDNFDYVRSALTLGAFDYILKSEMNLADFLKQLESIRKHLKNKKDKDVFYEEGKLSALITHLGASGNAKDSENYAGHFPETYSMLLLQQSHIFPCISEICGIRTEETSEAVIKEVVYGCSEKVLSIAKLDSYQYVVLMSAGGNVNMTANGIRNALQKRLSIDFSLLILNRDRTILELIENFIREKHLIREAFFFPSSVVLDAALMDKPQTKAEINYDLFRQYFQDRQYGRVFQSMEQTFFNIIQSKDYESLCSFLQFMIHHLAEYHDKIFDYKRGKVFSLFDRSAQMYWTCVHDVEQWLKEKYLLFDQMISTNASYQYSREVFSAIRYILLHYADCNLSSEGIAGHVGLSVNHLNLMMKKEEYTTIWKYLTRVRMEKARELIWGGTHKISDIYKMVGYMSISSFSRAYKKAFGVSPQGDRRNRSET